MPDTAVAYFQPRLPNRSEITTVRFGTEELQILDREAARFGVSRSEFVRVAVGRLIASLPADAPTA